MEKYYINYESKHYLVDTIDTPYLKDRGYKEVSKAEYDEYVAKCLEEYQNEFEKDGEER